MQNFSKEWLKTAHLQLSQKSFKACLKKADNHSTFYSSQQSFILFLKIEEKNQTNKNIEKKKNKSRNCTKKKIAKGDAVYIVNALKEFLKKMKQKRPLKKIKK